MIFEVNALNPEIYYSNYPVCMWGFSFGMERKHQLKEPLPLHAIGLEIINSKKKSGFVYYIVYSINIKYKYNNSKRYIGTVS